MAPKKGGGGGDDDVKREKPLQAVVLADSFTSTFRPISVEQPKVLFPLGDAPMLAYTLEMLASNDVIHVYVFCINHPEKIKAYIEESGWAAQFKRVGGSLAVGSLEVLSSSVCTSAGDVMRELDQLGIIESDPFILVSGDVVSNMDLRPSIEAHKARRKERAENIMTVLYKQVGRCARARPLADDLIVGLDDNTNQIVFYSDDPADALLKLPNGVLSEHESMTLRSDLLDCHVDICSPEVLWRFSENFDYLELRKGFLASEVANLDLGQYIYAHIVGDPKAYSARVHDPKTYHAVCSDFVHRWIYPIVPELNLSGKTHYRRTHVNASSFSSFEGGDSSGGGGSHRALLYKDEEVEVPRSAKLFDGVMLGAHTKLGESCVVRGSTIGANCVLGDECTINQSHLWANVTVEANAKVDHAILCDGVIVKSGAKIGKGCVLSFGVVVGANVVLPPYTRLTLSNAKEDDGFGDDSDASDDEHNQGEGGNDNDDVNISDHSLVGPDGKGKRWVADGSSGTDGEDDDDDSDDEVEVAAKHLKSKRAEAMGADACLSALSSQRHLAWTVDLSDDEDDDESDDLSGGDNGDLAPSASGGGYEETESTASAAGGGKGAIAGAFEKAISDILVTGWEKKEPVEALLMEVNCYKLAQNKSFDECLVGSANAILSLSVDTNGGTAVQFLTKLKQQLLYWKPLLRKLTQGEPANEVAWVKAVEAYALRESAVESQFARVLKLAFDLDVLSDEGILLWASNHEHATVAAGDDSSVASKRVFEAKQTKDLIAWLEESEEEDDESGEEEESD